MQRRTLSPLKIAQRTSEGADYEHRDGIIRKLKEDLSVARGKRNQLLILENYLGELLEKNSQLKAEIAKTDEEGKLKIGMSLKNVTELKKEVESLKEFQRNQYETMKELNEDIKEYKRELNNKEAQIDTLKKDAMEDENEMENLLNELSELKIQEEDIHNEMRRLTETIRNREGQVLQVKNKIIEVNNFIGQKTKDNALLKEELINYQNRNGGIYENILEKETTIDGLEKTFVNKHDEIKEAIERYIELQHQNEKTIKQTQHLIHLLDLENDKNAETLAIKKKHELRIAQTHFQKESLQSQCEEIRQVNKDYNVQNSQLKKDLQNCRLHLDTILKENKYIQDKMEQYVREDDEIINVIKSKRLLPTMQNLESVRNSRLHHYHDKRY